MAVLIKGMKMPNEDEEIIIRIDSFGTVMTEYALPIVGVKAVPVPEPHGRLIDADALINDHPRTWTTYDLQRIANAPTIIPASEEK